MECGNGLRELLLAYLCFHLILFLIYWVYPYLLSSHALGLIKPLLNSLSPSHFLLRSSISKARKQVLPKHLLNITC